MPFPGPAVDEPLGPLDSMTPRCLRTRRHPGCASPTGGFRPPSHRPRRSASPSRNRRPPKLQHVGAQPRVEDDLPVRGDSPLESHRVRIRPSLVGHSFRPAATYSSTASIRPQIIRRRSTQSIVSPSESRSSASRWVRLQSRGPPHGALEHLQMLRDGGFRDVQPFVTSPTAGPEPRRSTMPRRIGWARALKGRYPYGQQYRAAPWPYSRSPARARGRAAAFSGGTVRGKASTIVSVVRLCDDGQEQAADPHRAAVAAFAVNVDTTIVNVALPSLVTSPRLEHQLEDRRCLHPDVCRPRSRRAAVPGEVRAGDRPGLRLRAQRSGLRELRCGSAPSAKSRVPVPITNGWIQIRYSSIRSRSISVAIRLGAAVRDDVATLLAF